jgi:hypothetical protein
MYFKNLVANFLSSLGTFQKNIPFYTHVHRWASTSTSISAVSDIRHRHLLFRYRKKICRTENSHSDIGRVPISTSESIPISDIQKILITSTGFEPKTLVYSATVLIYEFLDVGYRIKVYSDIRYNVGLRSLQSDIGSSDIKLSPISLITDIGVSAHLCPCVIEIYHTSVGYLKNLARQKFKT